MKTAFKLMIVCLAFLTSHSYAIEKDTLAILSFNDFHGAFVEDASHSGAAKLVGCMNEQSRKYATSVVVSVGDNFSGTYFSRISRGKPLPHLFKAMDVELSAVGNHEFDWGLKYLTDSAAVYSKFVSANITTNGVDAPSWLKPYQIVKRTLKSGKEVKIAFVGLTTTETPLKTSPANVAGLKFIHPLGAAAVETLYGLKKEGKVDMIVLLMHIGTNMNAEGIISESNAIVLPYLDKVDAIISGHSHKVVLAKVNNVPIIQAGVKGSHVGKLLFEFSDDKVKYIGGDTVATKSSQPNEEVLAELQKYIDKYQFNKKLTLAKSNLIHNRNINKFEYTSVGAYITAGYANFFAQKEPSYRKLPIIGVNHFGGIRSGLLKGDISKLAAGNVLPFGGRLVAYHFTGKRLKQLLQMGRENRNGFLQTSNVELMLDAQQKISKIYYIQPSSKQSIEIKDDDQCIVTLDTFITTGGDGYDASLFKGYEVKEFNAAQYETTKVFIDYLDSLSFISEIDAPKPIVM